MNHSTIRLGSLCTVFLAVLVAALASLSVRALAQQPFPSKPVRLVIPFPPGVGPDAYLRPFALKLAEQLGAPVVVENRVGGAGGLSLQVVARAAPDGHTLTVMTNSNLIQKNLQPAVAYHPIAEFAQISMLVTGAPVLVVPSNSPARTVAELLAIAKASPGKLNYGSGGIGTPSHLAAATLQSLTGIDTVHVPFKNPGEVVPALLRGDLHFSFQVVSFALPLVKAGKLRALGVGSSARMRELPDVPTLKQLLDNDLIAQDNWVTLAAPAATPAVLVKRLHAETVTALAHPPLIRQIEAGGTSAAPSASPDELTAYVKGEFDKWARIVKLSGAKPD